MAYVEYLEYMECMAYVESAGPLRAPGCEAVLAQTCIQLALQSYFMVLLACYLFTSRPDC